MAYDDLRSFLDTLDKEGQLLRLTEELSPEPDLAAAANAVTRLGDSAPALFFTNVMGFTNARIAMNVHGSWANHALALGLPKGTGTKAQVDEFIARWAKFPVKPEWRDNPPWAQNSQEGDDVNIFEVLPLVRLNDGDGGFYIDKAAVISKDPDDPHNSDKQNVGMYRIEVKGTRKLALQPVPMHDIAQHLRKAEEKGQDLPIAITLGNDPVLSIVASTSWLAPCAARLLRSPQRRAPGCRCRGAPRWSWRASSRAANARSKVRSANSPGTTPAAAL